jgi:uncharacterized membrane protein
VKKIRISRIEIVLVLILLTFGIPMILLIPLGAGYDEEDHLVRVWEISAFSFIPGQIPAREMKYPKLFRDLAYRHLAVAGTIDARFWQTYGGASLDEHGYVSREINTKSVYSPALLLPQATVMRYLGMKANMPALLVFYMCRFASLISYLILVWLAIRLIPFGKWILLGLAVSPIALFQAATISADAISNGLGFLFIAGSLRAAKLETIDWREFRNLILLIFLLFLAKLNLGALVLLLFLLISPSRYTKKVMYPLLIAVTVILFYVEVAGWNILASQHMDAVLANEADPAGQVSYILSHPFGFFQTLVNDLLTNGPTYFWEWVNGYGYYYWTPPKIVSILYLLGLCAALFINPIPDWVNRKHSIAFIILFVISYLATILSLYLSFTPIGSDKVLGVQGRYFIPLALLLFLALADLPTVKRFSLPSKWMISLLTIALSLNILGILLAFYIPCGTTFYQTGLCFQPVFKDFTPESHVSAAISNENSLAQEIQMSCNGLAELRVLLYPPTSSQGSTRFTLHDPLSNRNLFDASIENALITAETWQSLSFDPDWKSLGRQYILTISSANTGAGQGPKFLLSPQAEFDLGNLYRNQQLIQDDIVLQYGCVTGLRKIWLTGKL